MLFYMKRNLIRIYLLINIFMDVQSSSENFDTYEMMCQQLHNVLSSSKIESIQNNVSCDETSYVKKKKPKYNPHSSSSHSPLLRYSFRHSMTSIVNLDSLFIPTGTLLGESIVNKISILQGSITTNTQKNRLVEAMVYAYMARSAVKKLEVLKYLNEEFIFNSSDSIVYPHGYHIVFYNMVYYCYAVAYQINFPLTKIQKKSCNTHFKYKVSYE